MIYQLIKYSLKIALNRSKPLKSTKAVNKQQIGRRNKTLISILLFFTTFYIITYRPYRVRTLI